MRTEVPYLYSEIAKMIVKENDFKNEMTFRDFLNRVRYFRIDKDKAKIIFRDLQEYGIIHRTGRLVKINMDFVIHIKKVEYVNKELNFCLLDSTE